MFNDCLLDEKMDGRMGDGGLVGQDHMTRQGAGRQPGQLTQQGGESHPEHTECLPLKIYALPWALSLPGRTDTMPRKEVEPVELPRQPEV